MRVRSVRGDWQVASKWRHDPIRVCAELMGRLEMGCVYYLHVGGAGDAYV
jgi:hypothetical protein